MGSTDLSKEKNPEWSQQRLFLKVLVEGSATLLYYEGQNLVRFFYSVPDSAIKQLIYKEYYVNANEVAVNNKFHEQLWIEVRCTGTSTSVIDQIGYRRSDLVKYFKNYNECIGNIALVYGKKDKKGSFHLKIAPGVNYTTMSNSNNIYDRFDVDFDDQIGFRLGLEAEFILPFNKNKWGFLAEPTYQYFNATKQSSRYAAIIKFNSVEFPIGLRYYLYFNHDMKIFLNAIFIPSLCLDLNSTLTYNYNFATPMDIRTNISAAFGGGIGIKRYSAEVRYYTNRDFLTDYASMLTNYQRFSFILGYRLF